MASSLLSPLFWNAPHFGALPYIVTCIYRVGVIILDLQHVDDIHCVNVAAHSPPNCFILIHSNNGWQAWI